MSQKPKYTPAMREVLDLSNAEARRLRHDSVGPEHLMLGIIRKGEGLAAQLLFNLEIELDGLKAELERRLEVGKRRRSGRVARNPEAERVLEVARAVAAELKHGWIGTEHLLPGLIKQEETLPSKVLCAMNVEFERSRREVLNIIEGSSTRNSEK